MPDTEGGAADMEFGVCVPNFRPGAAPQAMLAAVETAERLGWSSAWTTDHLLPGRIERARPFSHLYEALTTLAWLGGQTSRLRLGMSVLVVPMRSAVVLAKELATIDALTGGRLIAGVGIGWYREEFGNVGAAERFGHRGAYLEEAVALWRHLWGGSTGPYEGRFDRFGEVSFSPLPPQGASLPIWIGATAEVAVARAGRIADGYQSTSTGPAEMRERARIARSAAEAAGRPMPVLSSRVSVRFGEPEGAGALIAGSPDEMAETVMAYRDAGVSHLALDLAETDPDALARAMERFDREVIAQL
jgi:probable F420-dependent oxidoreductase